MPSSPLDRIRVARLAASDVIGSGTYQARPHAIGWATVELDRAASELARDLGIRAEAFVEAADSAALGARCRVVVGALPGSLSLVILEPATEGRLAATLARLGEGPTVTWYRTEIDVDWGVSGARAGPFGSERLVAGDPIHGPHRLLIGPATGTIAS